MGLWLVQVQALRAKLNSTLGSSATIDKPHLSHMISDSPPGPTRGPVDGARKLYLGTRTTATTGGPGEV